MKTSDQLRAQLALAELEEEMAAAKDSGLDPSDLRDLKERVREARRDYRENWRSEATDPGSAVARPETIKATAGVVPGGN